MAGRVYLGYQVPSSNAPLHDMRYPEIENKLCRSSNPTIQVGCQEQVLQPLRADERRSEVTEMMFSISTFSTATPVKRAVTHCKQGFEIRASFHAWL